MLGLTDGAATYAALSEVEWQERIEAAWELLRGPCRVCPRYCKVDRTDREVSPNTYVNVMGQYRPDNRAWQHPQLGRAITHDELVEAVRVAREEGLSRFDERWMGLA